MTGAQLLLVPVGAILIPTVLSSSICPPGVPCPWDPLGWRVWAGAGWEVPAGRLRMCQLAPTVLTEP